jgi:hypothetical protein
MGAALNRVVAALEAHGRGPRHYGSGAITAHCPGPGHWRGDLTPSLRVGWGKDCALVYCQAGCNTEDVLAAIDLTPADLFDQPRKRPDRPTCNQLKAAIGKARHLAPADRCLYLWLLWSANWDTAMIPAAFQPKRPARPLRGLRAAQDDGPAVHHAPELPRLAVALLYAGRLRAHRPAPRAGPSDDLRLPRHWR